MNTQPIDLSQVPVLPEGYRYLLVSRDIGGYEDIKWISSLVIERLITHKPWLRSPRSVWVCIASVDVDRHPNEEDIIRACKELYMAGIGFNGEAKA